MANSRILSAFTVFIAVFLTYLTPTLALATDPKTGEIICIPTNNPNICQARVTIYYENGAWPYYSNADYPYNNHKYPDNYYDVWIDVFDPVCIHLGIAVGGQNSHISVDSELPWTVEMDLPLGYARWDETTGWYAGHQLWPSNNVVTYLDPFTPTPWGGMTTALYGFPC